ncbi:ATP-binding cassette subfamily G member 4 [Anabrus simplex]|uniref:ATP-binding cassette subfamily G member 4 n=1 Tax=Anabrus simplex TaxID=316456 RepID=UPI0035A37EFA
MLNGKLNWRPSLIERDPHLSCDVSRNNLDVKLKVTFDSTGFQQFYVLLSRMLLQRIRNKTALFLQVLYNVGVSFAVGSIYYQKGNDAESSFTNFRFLLIANVCFLYSNMIIPTLCFPHELKLIQREYLNRWYGLKAYFMAYLIANIPGQIIFGSIFATIIYVMSGQPLELHRLLLFTIFAMTSGFVSEGHGMVVGTIFNEVNGAIVGPATIAPLLAMSVIGMGYGTSVKPFMKLLRSLSFMRYSLVGMSLSIFGMNRQDMDCAATYCYHQDPKILLRDLGMAGDSIYVQFLVMAGFYTFYRVAAFLALRYRLSLEFSARLHALVHRILRRKSNY